MKVTLPPLSGDPPLYRIVPRVVHHKPTEEWYVVRASDGRVMGQGDIYQCTRWRAKREKQVSQ